MARPKAAARPSHKRSLPVQKRSRKAPAKKSASSSARSGGPPVPASGKRRSPRWSAFTRARRKHARYAKYDEPLFTISGSKLLILSGASDVAPDMRIKSKSSFYVREIMTYVTRELMKNLKVMHHATGKASNGSLWITPVEVLCAFELFLTGKDDGSVANYAVNMLDARKRAGLDDFQPVVYKDSRRRHSAVHVRKPAPLPKPPKAPAQAEAPQAFALAQEDAETADEKEPMDAEEEEAEEEEEQEPEKEKEKEAKGVTVPDPIQAEQSQEADVDF